MKYGFFVHYAWDGTNDPIYYPETINPDGSLPAGLDDLANRFDAIGFANDLASMGVQYVFFTAWHANMNCLWPSPAMNRWLTGHTSQRDVLRDMITAVKAKGIKVLFYTNPVEGYALSAADQAATGYGPTFNATIWNNFINDLYGDLISLYGNDIEGVYLDDYGGDPRLRNTIKAANTNLVIIMNGPGSIYCDYGDVENNGFYYGDLDNNGFYALGPNAWSAPGMPSALIMSRTWWATVPVTGPNAALYPPEAIFRYTVLMAGVSNSAGGAAWAAGPYAGGGWEPGVLTTMQAVGAYIAAIGLSITNTYASTAYVTPAGVTINSLQWGVVATRSIDDAYEYIHVLTPPAGNTLTLPPPADRKIFASAQLLANSQPVTLVQDSAGVRLSLQGTKAWNSLDTVIALTVAGVAGVAPSASFSDDFSNGTNGWLFTGGNWSVASDTLSQTNTAGFGYTATVMLGQWADADYEFDFRIVNDGGDPSDWAGCNFRKTNPTDNQTDSGYLVYCRANGQVCLYTASSGDLASANTGLAFTNLTHVKIVAAGTNMTIYLADSTTPVISFNDSTYPGQGYFSLTTGSTSAQFGNVVITPLDVSAAPPILSPPASQTAFPGQNVSFNVYAGSATPPTYQWQAGALGSGIYTNLVNGGQISGATSNVLTISNVTTNWALDYVVIVSNTNGSVTSAPPATLTMQFLPVITLPPASQGAVAGQTVSFSVTASGAAPLGYQWQAGPGSGPYTNLVDGPQVGGSTSSTLTISSLTTNWLLAYQVVVTTTYGSITSTPPALLTFIQTNYLDFSTTTVGPWAGPVSPANGVTSISGAGLNVGDKVVFDGLVIDTNALPASNAWGGVELNQGGNYGLEGAELGTAARLASDYPCEQWINGFGPGIFPGTSGYPTNRVRIELTATAAGSTTNMSCLVEIDQGLTGTFTSLVSGAGVNFSGNTITLTFAVGSLDPDRAEFIDYHTPDLGVPASPSPTITGFTKDPATEGFTLSGSTDIAGNVVVWAATSLAPPIDWIAIQTNAVPGGAFSFTAPGTNSQAFYKLMGQ